MKIYVASLSDYNNGILFGNWFDLDNFTDADELQDAINAMLANSPTAKSEGIEAEEWAIHDYEDAPKGFGEHEDLERLIEVNDCINEYGDAFIAYLENVDNYGDKSGFDDMYYGEFESEEAFAEHIVDECGYLKELPENLRYYFDYEKFARDLFMTDFDFFDGYVFHK